MKLLFGFVCLSILPALAVLPPGVTKNPVPSHPDITVYEWPSTQTLPPFWDSFFKLFRLPSGTKAELPFQRSVAVIVGIGHYKFITPRLEYVSKDVEKMRDYLLGDGGFDAVYVMDEGVSPEVVSAFMSDEMPQKVGPKDRLLFYYSGHGADPGTGRPVLQFQQARPGQWGQNVLRVDEYEQWSGLLKAEHVLFLYDACTAGEATMAKGGKEETRTAVTELSGNGSRIVVTAGTANQEAWVVKESSSNQYSIFTEALLRVLRDGTAESKQRGFITIGQAVGEASVVLADMTRHLGPGHEMNPDPVNIDRARTGTFVFLNPHADQPKMPDSDILAMNIIVPKGAGGTDLDKERELALWNSVNTLDDQQYARFCNEYPSGLFCAAARKRIQKLAGTPETAPAQDLTILTLTELRALADTGSRDALTQLGRVYESGLQGAPMDLQVSIGFYMRASDLGDGGAAFRIGSIYDRGRVGVPKDEARAVVWYRKAAEAGNAPGMVGLGFMYRRALGGVAKDEAQAVIWYRKAAEEGNGRGMVNLGVMYEQGLGGLAKDQAQAAIWYRKAAEEGDGLGMANLGLTLRHGRGGLAKDEMEALVWFRKAAEAGDGEGMANLGSMYENGRGGLAKDETQAVIWYRKAAETGDAYGMVNLGAMYQSGRGGLARDEARALTWYRKAAETGDGPGMANLGLMFEHGRGGLTKDAVQAVIWYRKAAEAGDGLGMANLGFMYANGLGGLGKDEAQAVIWYRKAAEAGNGHGMANLGYMYEKGLGGLASDAVQAVIWYRKAAEAGDGPGMANLGAMYENGLGGLPKDEAQAAIWFRQAAGAGDGYGMAYLGAMYENGLGGLPKDEAQAAIWYRKAADLGNDFGQAALARLGAN
ncbi:MAG TPA: caspase family protein [Bryobacteraceae bacterium]|nr:caspase family protein [Bryobacteraceae bacterium]